MKPVLAALVLVLAATTARAQPGTVQPVDPEEPPPPAFRTPPQSQDQSQDQDQDQGQLLPPRSESTALWLSLGGTLGSYALLFGGGVLAAQSNGGVSRLAGWAGSVGLAGTLLAPTFGHWYGGKGFTRGFALRLGGIGLGITAVVVALSGCRIGIGGHDQEQDSNCGQGNGAAAVIAILAAGAWIGGTVDDIVQAPRRVRRRNAARFAVAPLMQGERAGLALVGSF